MRRRFFIVLMSMAGLNVSAAPSDYPARTLTIVVPQQAGGATDTVARVVANSISRTAGVNVIVDNKPGAGGNIGTAFVARSKPDGYTVIMNGNAQILNPMIYQNAGYDAARDFASVALIARGSLLLVAHPGFEANNVQELLAAGRAAPDRIFYASPGKGTGNHLAAVMLEHEGKVKFTPVHYKGAPAALADVVAGQVSFTFAALSSVQPYLAKNQVKVLAVANPARVAGMPHVPSITETLPQYTMNPWTGMFAPAGVPPDILAKLHGLVNAALKEPELKDVLQRQGQTPGQDSQRDFSSSINSQMARWQKVVNETNVRAD